MKFFIRFVFLLFICCSSFCTYGMGIQAFASAAENIYGSLPKEGSWNAVGVNDDISWKRYVTNIARGCAVKGGRHLSLVSVSNKCKRGEEYCFFPPHIFVSGITREGVRDDIVGLGLEPNVDDFWLVFHDIAISGFTCHCRQAQSVAHSERAACVYVLKHNEEIVRRIKCNEKIQQLTLRIFNLRDACNQCRSFMGGHSKMRLGDHHNTFIAPDDEQALDVSILQALQYFYQAAHVKIEVYSGDNNAQPSFVTEI